MTKTASEIRDALAAKIKDEIPGPVLLRMIAEYDGWMMPNSFMSVGEPPIQYALMFTDEDAYKFAQNEFGESNVPDEYLQLTGSKILAELSGMVDSISVNPCAAESISFPKQMLPELEKLGQAIEVERALSSVLQNETGWKTIRNFGAYIVPVAQAAHGQFAPYPAPDSLGRKLLAAFTHSDALNAYVFAHHDGKPVYVTIYTGDFLCKWILESACDGVMFNCSGPNRPISFPKDFARTVLEHGA